MISCVLATSDWVLGELKIKCRFSTVASQLRCAGVVQESIVCVYMKNICSLNENASGK